MIDKRHISKLIKQINLSCNDRLRRETWDSPAGRRYIELMPSAEYGDISKQKLKLSLKKAYETIVKDPQKDNLGIAIICAINVIDTHIGIWDPESESDFESYTQIMQAWFYLGKEDVE